MNLLNLNDPVQFRQFVLFIGVFGLVFSIWCMVLLLLALRRRSRDEAVRRRLGLSEGEQSEGTRVLRLWVEGREAATIVHGQKTDMTLAARLERLRRRADWNAPISSLVLSIIGIVGGIFIAGWFIGKSPVTGAACSLVAAGVISMWINQRIQRRQSLFENQLLDALGLAARSLRAGHPLHGAFQLIVDEMSNPIREVFAQVCQEQELGVSMEDALARAAMTAESDDLRFFAAAVIIQIRTGGNLADMMERLADVIRERMRLARRVRVLTTQTQYSKRVLIAMPFIIFMILQVLNPEYVNQLFTTEMGRMMLGVGMVMVLVGNHVMNKMAVLRY